MARLHRRMVAALSGGTLLALIAAPLAAASPREAPATPRAVAEGNASLVMVLDSSGSMAEDDGSGSTRIESARRAVGTVVDALPDGHPTGLRVYGADREEGCTDTRLVRPVEPLDRAALKRAVAGVEPRGDTPIGLALRRAAEDLPGAVGGSLDRRTILLVSDGEDTCGTPDPCEVARELGGQGPSPKSSGSPGSSGTLRIDAIGFQVDGKAREQLECIARAGHGSYYDAPDADALARQLQRASRLSADGYRMEGERITGGRTADDAPEIAPGQYTDTIGPGEKRWYAAKLGGPAESAADDLAVTAVPQPGVPVASMDGLRLTLVRDEKYRPRCGSTWRYFGRNAGAMPITAAVSRIPSADGDRACDGAGRYLLTVERRSHADSDRGRWPFELLLATEKPLAEGTVPAHSEPHYGAGGKDAPLPTDPPRDVEGGTGFNDARRLGPGVWRDELIPAQTRWYRVRVGWGQQLRYDVEFGNEPTVDGPAGTLTRVSTEVYGPTRVPVRPSGEFDTGALYRGEPAAVSGGTVPVAWTNRWESAARAVPVRRAGEYYIGVGLDPDAAELAENVAVGFVLRVAVIGEERTGPEHGAPAVRERGGDRDGGQTRKETEAAGDGSGPGGAGWSGPAVAAAAGAVTALAIALAAVYTRYTRSRGRTAARTAARTAVAKDGGAGRTADGTGNGAQSGKTEGGAW
ncbi:vWA domain-containing protein [Streptomyces pini]|uniref:Ca-activated chloride channel family protein n=1 Tax=Streptomyces pini TaxID=1520580 RepID=A0A1I4FRU5_9ACTN|nr:VWA domain-containing protein [Streptomyces pini]SFL19717.1 Ca-activated chloride channel family protein [Streptomyces pini]